MSKTCVIVLLLLAVPCLAENYLLNGGQTSEIDYRMIQEIVPSYGTRKLIVSYVVPQSFSSPSYNQDIQDFSLRFSIEPDKRERKTDKRGNRIIKAIWKRPQGAIRATIAFKAMNHTKLQPLETKSPFPVQSLPADVRPYLEATKQAPSGDPAILKMAKDLTAGSRTQFDAVQKILSWIVDHMTYVLRPASYDAAFSIETGKGNCQNYSHVAATLMRAVNIPVRIVNGITLRDPYTVRIAGGRFSLRMAQGRHSWIEVFFPDLGWVPFDPQQMQLFVSNRFIRVEIGRDNRETVSDGTVWWTRARGTKGTPRFRETIRANFTSDKVDLFAEKQPYGPRKVLFTPPVQASYTRIPFEASETPPTAVPVYDLEKLTYDEPFLFGNLDFPEGLDFSETRIEAEQTDDSTLVLHKNFLVETSEYATFQGQKYAQTFLLQVPLKLEKTGLALHKFGGSGQLWIELYKDDGDGRPGEAVSTSEFVSLNDFPFSPGYRWVDFEFKGKPVTLSPGRYWIALAYTGSPIVNWFYSYGKPVGPADGTRYNTMFDETWSHALTYEFNYRIIGRKGTSP